MAGWTERILDVDLNRGVIEERGLGGRVLRDYLGGRGLGARLLFDTVRPGADPFSPENCLILTTGPLTATRVPTSGRFSATTVSPLTGTILDSNSGGFFGARLKRAGFDALVIRGRSSEPAYLEVSSREVALKPAGDLWGKDVWETTSLLEERHGPGTSVAAIGPAGERLVRFAAVINDYYRALGRGGVGAVMGSKNLKAITVKGQGRVAVADPGGLAFILGEVGKWVKANPITSQGLPEFGTAVLVNLMNEMGIFPINNFQRAGSPLAPEISGERLADTLNQGNKGCYGCTIRCSRLTSGPAGNQVEGPEYESLWSLGADCGVFDLPVVTAAHHLCNRLGIDTISMGGTLACAMELSGAGLLPGGPHFGDASRLLGLIEDTAYRRGLGELFAEGSRRMAANLGMASFAMEVKGMELPGYDPRGAQGMGLGLATSNRGGCHLRAYMVGPEILGIPKLVDRLSAEGKAGLTIHYQNAHAAVDSLILCRFLGFAVSEEYYARLLAAVVGIPYEPQDLHLIGERIWNLERLYNLLSGFTAADDTLPRRLLEEGVPVGTAAGQVVRLGPMLAEYYRYRGWDESGRPTVAKLERLGLEMKAGV